MNKVLGIAALAVGLALGVSTPASANADGEKVYKKFCTSCHSVQKGKNQVGPSLSGIVGRKAGTVEGFKYSDVNAKSGVMWDEAQLDKYLTDPKAYMPGNKMVFNGVKKDEERKNLIAYLVAQK